MPFMGYMKFTKTKKSFKNQYKTIVFLLPFDDFLLEKNIQMWHFFSENYQIHCK
jgi:hypothetical protein